MTTASEKGEAAERSTKQQPLSARPPAAWYFWKNPNVGSGIALADADSAPGMLSRGKLQPRRERIHDTENMRRIFRLCEEPAGEAGRAGDAAPKGGERE